MSENVIFFFYNLATLTIMYLAFTFSPKLSRAHTYFGLYLPAKYQSTPEAKQIFRRFFIESTLVYLLLVVASFFHASKLTTSHDSSEAMGIVIFCFGYLAVSIGLYIRAYKKVQQYSASLPQEAIKTQTKVVIDTDWIAEKNRIKRIFALLYSLPVVLSVFLLIYSVAMYPALPDTIPTHWDFAGVADSWSSKSYGTILGPGLLQVGVMVMVAISGLSTFSTRGKLNGIDLEKSKKRGLSYIKSMALSVLILLFSILGLFTNITFSTIQGGNMDPTFNYLSLGLMVIGILILLVGAVRFGNGRGSKTQEVAPRSPEDKDEYWIYGFLYNNPQDPAIFIEKRYGIGWTLNIGTPIGKIIGIATIILLLVCIILPFVF